ncbi:MAG: GntR family transcriptional regulator [Aquabacterium sp.]
MLKRAAAPQFSPIAPEAAGMPLYRAVKRGLLAALADGRIAPGAALPSETVLAGQMQVSIGTLRRAVDELVAENLLTRHQGRGTYAAQHSADGTLFQFFHVERADGLREAPTVELLSFDRTRLDDDTAAALRRRPGEAAFSIENRLSLQGRPVVHDRLWLPAALFKGLTEKRLRDRPSTLYPMYQAEFGITVVRAHERARAVPADRAAQRVLGLATGAPVLQVRRTALTFGDRPVEFRLSMVNTAQHEYVQMLARPG